MQNRQQLELKLASLGDDDPSIPELHRLLEEENRKRDTRRMKSARKAMKRKYRHILKPKVKDLRLKLQEKGIRSEFEENLAALSLNAPIYPENEPLPRNLLQTGESWEDQLDFEFQLDSESMRAESPDSITLLIDDV